jgi:hypothetical protein
MEQSNPDGSQREIARKRLTELHRALLRLHKTLLDAERTIYEREHGQVSSSQLLQLVLNDEQFAWLRRISKLIVSIDEAMDEPDSFEGAAKVLIAYAKGLLQPEPDDDEFHVKYHAALQSDPASRADHEAVQQILSAGI